MTDKLRADQTVKAAGLLTQCGTKIMSASAALGADHPEYENLTYALVLVASAVKRLEEKIRDEQ